MREKRVSEIGITGLLSFAPLNEREKILIETILQVMAHEIRNPIVAIGAFARKLVDMPDGSESARYAGIVLREAIRLEALLKLMVDEDRSNGETPCPPDTRGSDT